jgi:membrane-bound lytic murein transglycosylase D
LASCFAAILFAFLTVSVQAQPDSAAGNSALQQKADISAAALNVPISRKIPWPEALQPDIDFWIRVYSEITTRQGFMHDEQNLSVVYATVAVPDRAPGSKERRAAIEGARERWQLALTRAAAARAQGIEPTDADARRVLEVWGSAATAADLRAAAARVRFQLGQADRFRAGIVRSGTWESHIARTLESKGLPKELASLPHVESSFEPTAYSKVGAAGLWQFMPATGRLYMRVDDVVDERLDPFIATESAARLLQSNYRVLGSWPLAITAYNHGTAGMRRARDRLGTDDYMIISRQHRSRTFGFASRNFYPSFLAAVTIDRNPEKYFGPVTRAPEAVFHEISLPAYVDLAPLAGALGVETKRLRELNPALRPAVWSGELRVPRGYRLRLPGNMSISVAQLQARVDATHWHAGQPRPRVHRIKKGETLSQIARRYGVSTQTLADLNNIRVNSVIRYGRTLRLPASAEGSP